MKFSKVNAWLMALSFTATTVCTNGLTVQAESSLPEVESNIQDETVIVGNSAGNIAGKVIGQEGFQNRNDLKNVILSQGITEIGKHGFFHCTSLKNVVMPSTVIKIGAGAFQDCTSLESIDLTKTKITQISEEAFRGCINLKKDLMPETVTSIEANAFLGCGALEHISLWKLKNLKKIGSGAFSNCISLKELTLPKQVLVIGGGAFLNCMGLESITIPQNVSYLGQGILEGASQVTVKGVINSYGYDYAMKKGLKFEKISEEIMVSDIQVMGETLKCQENIKKLRVKQGQVVSLDVKVMPGNATDSAYTWEIEKPEVLSIDSNGKLTGSKKGFTGVILRAKGGVNKKDYFEVSVV